MYLAGEGEALVEESLVDPVLEAAYPERADLLQGRRLAVRRLHGVRAARARAWLRLGRIRGGGERAVARVGSDASRRERGGGVATTGSDAGWRERGGGVGA